MKIIKLETNATKNGEVLNTVIEILIRNFKIRNPRNIKTLGYSAAEISQFLNRTVKYSQEKIIKPLCDIGFLRKNSPNGSKQLTQYFIN
jgi:hypothetical protein